MYLLNPFLTRFHPPWFCSSIWTYEYICMYPDPHPRLHFGIGLFGSQIEINLCFMHGTLVLLCLSLGFICVWLRVTSCIGFGLESHFRSVYVYDPDGITLCSIFNFGSIQVNRIIGSVVIIYMDTPCHDFQSWISIPRWIWHCHFSYSCILGNVYWGFIQISMDIYLIWTSFNSCTCFMSWFM